MIPALIGVLLLIIGFCGGQIYLILSLRRSIAKDPEKAIRQIREWSVRRR